LRRRAGEDVNGGGTGEDAASGELGWAGGGGRMQLAKKKGMDVGATCER